MCPSLDQKKVVRFLSVRGFVIVQPQAEMLFHHPLQFPGGKDLQPFGISEQESHQFTVDDDVEFEYSGAVLIGFNGHLAHVKGFGLDIWGFFGRGPEAHLLPPVSG